MSAARRLSRAQSQEPSLPPIPQPVGQPVPPPKQITYPNVVINVQPVEGGVVLIIAAPGETLLFPMGAEYAQDLGRKLSAPHVIPATNGHGGSPR